VRTVGARIRDTRLAKGMTQRQLGERAGVGVPYISGIETGKERAGETVLQRIALALDIDPDELAVAAGRIPAYLMDPIMRHPGEAVATLRSFARTAEGWRP
jgi:transcriptional regulator with XRE-family HTH domain